MTTSSSRRLLLLATLLAVLAAPAAAEPIRLREGFQVGDTYALSLSETTKMEALGRSDEPKYVAEDVQIDYRATVLVLEVDDDGRPVRERHLGARLNYLRPNEEFGSLFKANTSFEVRRREGIQIFENGVRAKPHVETPVVQILDSQFEQGLGPQLLQPAPGTEAGDSWELNKVLAREFVRGQGVHALRVGHATAKLTRDESTGGLAIEYEIPVTNFLVRELPETSRQAQRLARVKGRVGIGPDGRPHAHDRHLGLEMHGTSGDHGAAHRVPWSLERSQDSIQRVVPVEASPANGGD